MLLIVIWLRSSLLLVANTPDSMVMFCISIIIINEEQIKVTLSHQATLQGHCT